MTETCFQKKTAPATKTKIVLTLLVFAEHCKPSALFFNSSGESSSPMRGLGRVEVCRAQHLFGIHRTLTLSIVDSHTAIAVVTVIVLG